MKRPRALMLAALVALTAGGAVARPVRVRAGEHGDFTRIVVDLGPGVGWQLGRSGADYVLTVDDPKAEPDLAHVFDQITRDRVQGLTVGSGGQLILDVGDDRHAQAFATAAGQTVIDVFDGPAPADSPFERSLVPARVPSPPHGPPEAAPKAAVGATLSFNAEGNRAASLPIYWREVLPRGEPAATGTHAGAESAAPTAPDQPVPPLDEAAPATAATVVLPLDTGPAPVAQPLLPPLPDPGILAVEDELTRQVARAASQGLAEVAAELPGAPAGLPGTAAPPAAVAAASPEADADAAEVAFHAETSMDRDGRENPVMRHMTGDGEDCPPRADFDLMHWGDDRPPMVQLTEARGRLTGEFDRPDLPAVERLARLYLYFGMGAEARQVLASFNVPDGDLAAERAMGLILDDRPVPKNDPLAGFAGCDTEAALWAFLATDGPAGDAPNVATILRTFAGLPPHLRGQIGPRLSDRLIGANEVDAARIVRDATARGNPAEDRTIAMMDAGIAMGRGQTDKAQAALDGLAEGTDPISSEALVRTIRSRLAAGQPVPAGLADAMTALAFEHRLSDDANELIRLEILARAASGDLSTAFARFHDWSAAAGDSAVTDTARSLFGDLVQADSDEAFVGNFFAQRPLLARIGPDTDLRLALAERMAGLGFTTEVQDLLTGPPGETERGRTALAGAALSAFDAAGALRLTEGVATPGAQRIRARALALQGDHAGAAKVLAALGDTEAAANEAWRGGDLAGAAASDALAGTIDQLGLGAAPKDPGETPGPSLAGSRALLAGSGQFRAALAGLLADPSAEPAPGN